MKETPMILEKDPEKVADIDAIPKYWALAALLV